MAAGQGAPVQDVVMEDAVSEVIDEGQVMRNELQELGSANNCKISSTLQANFH